MKKFNSVIAGTQTNVQCDLKIPYIIAVGSLKKEPQTNKKLQNKQIPLQLNRKRLTLPLLFKTL